MTTERRIAKLEAALPPRRAVLLWLHEMHQHGSLDAYMAWLLDHPASQAPAIVIVERAAAAARAAHSGEPRSVVRGAEDRAIADAVFLFMLIIKMELDATAMIRIGRLRLAALRWELRARTAEGASDGRDWETWRTGVIDLGTDLARTEAARRLLAVRYLDGRETLSPTVLRAWDELREGVAELLSTMPTAPGSRRRRRPDGDAIRRTAERTAPEEARTLVERVRAQTLDLLGNHAGAAAIVKGALRGRA